MSRETQAEVFIKTLAQMLDDERERRSIQLRRQNKAHAERFLQSCRAEFDGGQRPSAWALQGRQAESDATGHSGNQ